MVHWRVVHNGLKQWLVDFGQSICIIIQASRELHIKITIEWAHGQSVMTVQTLFCFLHDTMDPYMTIKIRFSHIDTMTDLVCMFWWWSQHWSCDAVDTNSSVLLFSTFSASPEHTSTIEYHIDTWRCRPSSAGVTPAKCPCDWNYPSGFIRRD